MGNSKKSENMSEDGVWSKADKVLGFFGFGAGGRMELELVNVKSSSPIEKGKVGVFMKHVRVYCTESLLTNPSCPV